MDPSLDITRGDPTWKQYEGLTVAEARVMPLRELQEHVHWVGARRGSGRRAEDREPGFPWFPNRMSHADLVDAVGNWAGVFDPAAGHPEPTPEIVATRPPLVKIGAPVPLFHARTISAETLIQAEMVAAAIIAEAGATPLEALRGWAKGEMLENFALPDDETFTERDAELGSVWSEAWGAVIEAVFGPDPIAHRGGPLFLEVLSDDDGEIDRFLGIFAEETSPC
jgi:hypothetical protein